ncbi:hypothetical protein [Sporisorium scitamineum]|uniref:C2H2-type domain-containing protein n=1 Tax=Sporisorium scitamineum TaxID=49012 RepID=A0A0F7S7S9_9BASI|nr:hypothetical protein [Sporisorium scitamineum]
MSHSAFDSTSSSTDSLLRSGDRSTASTSPPTSLGLSYDNRSAHHKAHAAESVRLPRIEAPGDFSQPQHRGLQGHKVLCGNHISTEPRSIGMRPGEPLPPSATGIFPPGHTHLFDRAMPYGDASNDMAKRNPKDNGSGAITVGGKKRYPCQHPGCDKTFSTSGHAARHNRIHTGQKPYRCTFPGCKARFSRQDNSLQHYRTHILHPKGRASQSAQARDAAAQLELDHLDLDAADAEAEAKAELGRRALEDGTAIAVVHEVKDQHGRKKGETIERMVGMPRSRRESLRGGLDDDRSASPSSIDDARMKRESSLPGVAPDVAGHYEAPADYWSSQMAKQGRLSLPHSAVAYDPRHRDPAPPAPYARDATMNGGVYPGSAPPVAWSQAPPPFIDPRFTPGYPRSAVSVSPHRRDVYDPSSRIAAASLDPELVGADASAAAEYHRQSTSTSSSQRDRVPPSVATLPPPGPASRVPMAAHAASAPVSGVPSARSSQSPKSSPTSSAYSVPEGIAASALDKLSAAAASSSPAATTSLSARGRLMGGANGTSAASSAGYQHPYSSDRSTNYASSSLPPISSARDRSSEDTLDLDRKTMSSSLRSGLAVDPKNTLPPLNPSAARRW